uniref:SGNH domain-containing protein n=1 Tax=Panagrolaimus davidi TaxID=227884 RepID=A0A914QTZ9_9BILA
MLFMIYALKGNLQSNPYILGNENEFQSCKPFYNNEYCKTDPIIEKYLTIRPKKHDYDRYCSFELNKTSTKSIMITGNSFVYFQIRGILEAIKQTKTKFSKAFVAAHIGCSLMAGTFNQKVIDWNCENIDGSHNALFNAVKPDVIIHTARLDHIIYDPIAPGDISNDVYYKEIERVILSMAKYTKKLIVIEPTPSLVEQTSITDGLV